MERIRLIHHLMTHYIARDEFRAAAYVHLQRMNMPNSTSYIHARYVNASQPLQVVDYNSPVIETTRKSLARCRHDTLDYLHELLHQEPYLDGDEHVHTDNDIFRYIIEEVDDRVPNLWTPLRGASG